MFLTERMTGCLDEGQLHVSKIAWLLGFSDVSAFTHTRRRWIGKTPSQLRTTEQPAHNAVRA